MQRILASVALLLALSAPALAQDGSACWLRDLERIDHTVDPPGGGDNAFFTRSGGPPNTYFLLANSTEAKQLPGFVLSSVPASERGCMKSTWLNARQKDGLPYATSTSYPDVDPGQGPGSPGNSDKGFPNYFQNSQVYRYLNWTTTSATGETSSSACNAIYGSGTPLAADCKSCLDTQKGYYLHPTDNTPGMQVFHGNWLRFFPPTHVMLRRVFKQAVVQIQRVRMGVAYFGANAPTVDPQGGILQQDVNPPCNLLGDTSASWTSNRGSIIGNWDGNGGTPSFGDSGQVVKTPLAEALLGIGAKYGDYGMLDPSYVPAGFAPANNTSGANNNNDSICVTCQFSSVIVIGTGDTPDLAVDSTIPPEIKALGVVPPGSGIKLGKACTPLTALADCGSELLCTNGTCTDESYFDDVAQWLANKDLRQQYCGNQSQGGGLCEPEQQHVATYTISLGKDSALYQSAALAGNGRYFRADDANQLATAIQQVIQDIVKRATSFSIAAISTVQTRGTSYAFIPRFRPSVQSRWAGLLYRFKMFNEFAAGCSLSDTQAPMNADKLSRNPNGDGDCDDVFLQDANGNFVGENEDGEFMVVDTTKANWPVTETKATPVWEAASVLKQRSLTSDPRRIYTVVDSDGDGTFSPGEQLEFSVANSAQLTPYLALGGLNGPVCLPMQQRLSKVYLSEQECAEDVIRFVRGEDVFDEDEDLVFDEPRPKILGDIFHSSPILVTPPTPRYLCDLGVSNQCLFSLYGSSLTPNGQQAYDGYLQAQGDRDQFVLVGANDGMVHAFHAGTRRFGDDPDTAGVEPATNPYYDMGTGRELWAFVPPDLLAKLKRLVTEERHELYVDEAAMVRDVWVDALDRGNKSADEFHTMAVFGEREGGRHYFGLDVTDPATPHWRWGWPKPGSPIALEAGESWAGFVPSAPPIGPVALADSAGALSVNGVKAREQYVVLLGGGYDRNYVRGRSVSMLDVWSGDLIWRFSRAQASGSADPRWSLSSVASGVAMLDIGPGPVFNGEQDGLFDTAVVGDLNGQVWTFRFQNPGVDLDGDGVMDNWFGGRAFAEFSGDSLWKRSPFFHVPSATVLPENGTVRAYLGSGDRQNIRDTGGGVCGLGNLTACRRKNCAVDATTNYDGVGSTNALGHWQQNAGATSQAVNAFSSSSPNAPTCSDRLRVDYNVTVNCGTAMTYDFGLDCDWGASTSGVDCASQVPWPPFTNNDKVYATQNSRFYSVRLFDGATRSVYSTASDAQRYDGALLTDSSLVNADVTPATSSSNGYYVAYPHQDENTASGSGLLAGCVLWNTLEPDPKNGACGANQGDAAKLYRAHYVTGSSDCGTWNSLTQPPRSVARRSIVPPPAPSPVIAINPNTGATRFSIITMDPGRPPAQVSLGGGDAAGIVHWLEVPRTVHRCRHETASCN